MHRSRPRNCLYLPPGGHPTFPILQFLTRQRRKKFPNNFYVCKNMNVLSTENNVSRKVKIKWKGKVFLISQSGLTFVFETLSDLQ